MKCAWICAHLSNFFYDNLSQCNWKGTIKGHIIQCFQLYTVSITNNEYQCCALFLYQIWVDTTWSTIGCWIYRRVYPVRRELSQSTWSNVSRGALKILGFWIRYWHFIWDISQRYRHADNRYPHKCKMGLFTDRKVLL